MSEEGQSTGWCEICKNETERKCSACKLVFYCSSEHQQQDWKEHKITCRPFEICQSNELRRYLKSTRDISVDDVIFTELPLVVGPKPQKISEGAFPCVGCCRLLYEHSCYRCSGCQWPVCKPDCQGLTVAAYHGFECKILRLRSLQEANDFYEYYRFDILIALRALYLKKYNLKKWEKLISLQDHLEQRNKGTDIFKNIDEKVQYLEQNYLKPLNDYEKQTNQTILSEVPSALIHKIYGILDINATEMFEEFDAIVLYPMASLLEHSCVPNVSQVIDDKNGFQITFRAAVPIQTGESITSICTHILWGTSSRRDHLKQTKYFTCTCRRCRDPTELDTYLSALRCLGSEQESCGGMQLPKNPTEENCSWACAKCGLELPDQDVMKFVNHLNEQVDKVMARKPKIVDLEDLIQKLSNFLHPNHYLMYTIKHSLVQLYGNNNNNNNNNNKSSLLITHITGEVSEEKAVTDVLAFCFGLYLGYSTNEDGIEISNNLIQEKLRIAKELIDITKKLDPGCARLSLYLAVLLNEQFTCKFKLLSRKFTMEEKAKFSGDCQEISVLLKDLKHVLRHEKNTSAGLKLFEVACNNEEVFKNWLVDNSMDQ